MTNEEVVDRSLNHSQIRELTTESLQKDPSKLCSGLVKCLAGWSVFGPIDLRATNKWKRLTQNLEEVTNFCPSCSGTGVCAGQTWECYRCGGTKTISAFRWKGAITA